jgi:CHAT domain-containing protein/tetratricopeptide (TPR) repeat protein
MKTKDKWRNTETARLLKRFNRVLASDEREEVLDAAGELLSSSSYERDLGDGPLRDSYVDALFDIADVFRSVPEFQVISPYGTNKPPDPDSVVSSTSIEAWKRAYSLDDGHIREGRDSSAREVAAHRLGQVYENARCHHTAVFWFRRSLSHARMVGLPEHLLFNLRGLARNLNTVGDFVAAGRCYDEMLHLLEDLPPAEQVSSGLAHAAMYHLQHGDQARGEAIMDALRTEALLPRSRYFPAARIPIWFAATLHGLGVHYIAIGRAQDAKTLAAGIIASADRFEKPALARHAMHGLAARAHIDQGNLDAALRQLSQVHDVNIRKPVRYIEYVDPTTLELWLDVARIHVANRQFALAFNAYRTLADNLGGLIVDQNYGKTTRQRMHWLQRVVVVVHEMASVWLNIDDRNVRRRTEAVLALALLQIKVYLFVGIEKGKSVEHPDITNDLFTANRRYAAAARKLTAKPGDQDALLELEAALFEREQLEMVLLPFAENQLVPPDRIAELFGLVPVHEFNPRNQSPAAAVAAAMVGDVRQLVGSERIFVDYSVIDIRPPHLGRQGPLRGRRYVGIRVSERDYCVRDLGDATEIDAKCGAFLAACSTQSASASDVDHSAQTSRHVKAYDPQRGTRSGQVDELAKDLYGRIVAPFEPMAQSLTVSPDGMLTAVPFYALMNNDRWLIEDTHITYCHSLHLVENLFRRQYNPETRHLPPSRKVALLLGDPDYKGSTLEPLPGTQTEIADVEKLLNAARFRNRDKVFDEVRVHTGPDATASRLLVEPTPRVMHIAAHGGFVQKSDATVPKRALRFGEYYRAWDEIGVAPMTEVDEGLLRCELRLSKDQEAGDDVAGDAALTALELSSLNLLGCHAVVLSACESGAGVPVHGAGALGFQYAVQSTLARSGLVSLWKVLDRETAPFMTDFYKDVVRFRDPRIATSYRATVKKYCRRDGRRVHPYYWAAFLFIDSEYDNPMPW